MLDDLRRSLKLWRCAAVGEGTLVLGKMWIRGRGQIRLGKRVVLDGSSAPIELHAHPGALLVIGDDVKIRGGASIEATESIIIGPRSLIGGFVKVMDNDFHGVSSDRHERPVPKPVMIEADVRIGDRCILLPGCAIGAGSRLEPDTVVSKRIGPKSWVKGNPPRVLKEPPP